MRFAIPLVFLVLTACSGAEPVPIEEPVPELAPQPQPAARADFSMAPVAIRWNPDTKSISVEAKLVGSALASRKEPIYVGVTVITDTDKVVDLLVHTLFPGHLEEALVFAAEIPHNPKYVLIGAWSTKIEPCKVDRPGCEEFGFVLDDSLASFPLGLYTEGMRQRFVPTDYAIVVKGPIEPVTKAASDFASIFGASVKTTAGELTQERGVWVTQEHDLGFAAAIAKELGGLEYGVVDGLPAPMTVVNQP